MKVLYERGVLLPEMGLWLDPSDPKPFAFVSHAHSDHTADHARVILSEPTARLMQARLGGSRAEEILPFGKSRVFDGWSVTLLPAGHIFGSAQIHVVAPDGSSLLYTGDFKLRTGLSAETIEWRNADTLVMETTFGLPRYKFPPAEDVLAAIRRFCLETIEDGDVPVLLGYSLGKAQEILSALEGMRVLLHSSVARMTAIYESLGRSFPPHETLGEGRTEGAVVVCPPNVARSRIITSIRNRRVAVLTGWACDPNAKFRYGCDEAFPLSDHADYEDLVRYVDLVRPKRILTLHGFAREFAGDLRSRGWDAWALTHENQTELELPRVESARSREGAQPRIDDNPESAFKVFCTTANSISATSSKLRKRTILAEYFRSLPESELPLAATYFSGRAFPQADPRVTQAGWALIRRALIRISGLSEADLREISRRHRDAGKTSTDALAGHTKPQPCALGALAEFFSALSAARGPMTKGALLETQLSALSSLEAGFVVRILTGDLRIGLKDSLIEDAIAEAFGAGSDAIREVLMLTGDLGETAVLAFRGALGDARMTPFRPIRCMLASPEPTAEAIWKRCASGHAGGDASHVGAGEPAKHALWVEDKFDGIRAQLHKVGDRVEIYSRDLRLVTGQFEEIARSAARLKSNGVFDGEIIAYEHGRKMTFFDLQKRLGRRDRDLFITDDIPVVYVVFDLLWLDGEPILTRPLRERRTMLDGLEMSAGMRVAVVGEVHSAAEIDAVFNESRERGNEGLMIKDPSSFYAPGRRGHSWIKLKKELATLDVVVTAVEQGHGKRSDVLSDYTFAVRDEKSGELLNIGKAYSGLTDAEIGELTEHFESRAVERKGGRLRVTPDVVLEIAFDSIQDSARHASGLAMRFPRIKRIRRDKRVEEIDTVETARGLRGK